MNVKEWSVHMAIKSCQHFILVLVGRLTYHDHISLSPEGLFCIFIVVFGIPHTFFPNSINRNRVILKCARLHSLSWIQDFLVLNRNADGGEILLSRWWRPCKKDKRAFCFIGMQIFYESILMKFIDQIANMFDLIEGLLCILSVRLGRNERRW